MPTTAHSESVEPSTASATTGTPTLIRDMSRVLASILVIVPSRPSGIQAAPSPNARSVGSALTGMTWMVRLLVASITVTVPPATSSAHT